jgi:hypothetical protein
LAEFFAEGAGGCVGGCAFAEGVRVVGGEQGVALDVSEEDAAAGFEEFGGAFEDAGEVGGVGEVLGDGVDDDGVEVRGGEI